MQVALDQSNSDLSLDTLITACENCIAHCHQILEQINSDMYVHHKEYNSSVGAHLRHIVERFHCFFEGHQKQYIDYDNRKRNQQLEQSLTCAKSALAEFTASFNKLRTCEVTSTNVSESVDANQPPVVVQSTIKRELMGLVTHTTHHLAIIVMLVNEQGGSLPTELGKAPSTLIYEKSL